MQLVSRKCYSPETALICFVNDIQRAIDGQCESILVLLDLFAAFETIDHAILLERLLSTTERLIHGFVSLKLDYCNSILHSKKVGLAHHSNLKEFALSPIKRKN